MMISSEMHDRLHLNHLSQKPQLTLSDLNGKMTLSTYQTMINSLFNVHFSSKNHQVLTFTLHLSLFQYCIELKLQQITFYFARAYLDNVIKNRHQLLILNVKLTCICCVWIAIKFNQQTRFSSYFTAQVMVSHGEATFINSQLIEMEKDICQLLNFKFGYTIPLAYAQTFFQSFPTFAYIKKVLYVLSDFTISITGLGWESAENLFYGIFIAALRIKKIKMNHSQISLFKQKVSKIQKILYIAQTISKAYISALESQDKLLNEPENDILLMLS